MEEKRFGVFDKRETFSCCRPDAIKKEKRVYIPVILDTTVFIRPTSFIYFKRYDYDRKAIFRNVVITNGEIQGI